MSQQLYQGRGRLLLNMKVGSGIGHHPGTPKEYFFSTILNVWIQLWVAFETGSTNQGTERWKTLKICFWAVKNEDYSSELDFVLNFYKDDFVHSSLRLQLELLTTSFSSCEHQPTLIEVRDYFRSLSPAQQSCMSEISTLLKLIMVIAATNAVSEWSASAVRSVKIYLRSTMTQLHFNNLLVLLVYKERTDTLQLTACLNDFVSGSGHMRISLFHIRNILSSLFWTFWVIFSCMFQCLTSISLKWNWCLRNHQKQSQTPLDYGVQSTPSPIPYGDLAGQIFLLPMAQSVYGDVVNKPC